MSEEMTDLAFEEVTGREMAVACVDLGFADADEDSDALDEWALFRVTACYRGRNAISYSMVTAAVAIDPRIDIGKLLQKQLLPWCQENHSENLPIDAPAKPVV